MSGRERRHGRLRRGASILPSLFTTGNLFLGFWAVVKVIQGDYAEAAPLIGWAIVLDMLDGRIARLTGTTSEFGAQLDSLADVISFGVATALLACTWGFSAVPRARGSSPSSSPRRGHPSGPLQRAAPGRGRRCFVGSRYPWRRSPRSCIRPDPRCPPGASPRGRSPLAV
jgi:hypothetical protein